MLLSFGPIAVRIAGSVETAVENVKEPAAVDQHGANRIGASGGDGQRVDGVELAGVVIDFVAADNAVRH